MRCWSLWCICALCVMLVGGCASRVEFDPGFRRDRLLELYPPGVTGRGDVEKRWAPLQPVLVAEKREGWPERMKVSAHVAASEGRTGKSAESVEVFAAKEGWFGVGYCWYFYDAQGRVVDAEWEYGKGEGT